MVMAATVTVMVNGDDSDDDDDNNKRMIRDVLYTQVETRSVQQKN